MIDGTFDAVFFTFVITSGISCFLGLARMAYKSKCKVVDCFCVRIERDTEVEEHEDMANMNDSNKKNDESKV